MIIAILIFALLFILPDLYISSVLMRGAAWWAHLLLWLPAITALGLIASFRLGGVTSGKLDIFTALLLCVALPQILFTVFSLLGKLTSFAWQPALGIGNGTGIAVGAVVSVAMLYGLLFGWKQLTVRNIDLAFDDLPEAFNGYRVAQLSDMHVGSYGTSPAFLEKVVQRVHDEQPDLIVFTGDLINTTPDEIPPFEHVLAQLHAKDGVLAVLGNHDYCLYGVGPRPTDPQDGAKQVVEAERRMGWQVLLNEHRLVRRGNDSIAIVGVENTGKPPFPEIGDLRGAMAGLSDSTFRILLSHDPSHWRMEVLPATTIPLTLSGHTHAAQFKIGAWSPSRWLYPEWSGLYEEGKQRLYVSEGIGGTIRFRFGATPEIIVLTLHQAK
jgi:hypothetical protein